MPLVASQQTADYLLKTVETRAAIGSLRQIQSQCVQCWSGFTARQQARAGSLKERSRILQIRVDQETHKAVLHLVPILFAPEDQLRGVRVVLVVRGIVVVRDSNDAGSLGNRHRLCEIE